MDLSSVNKHFTTANAGFITTSSGEVDGSNATVIPLNSVTGLIDESVFVGIIDPNISQKEQAFTGVVDAGGSQITDVVWTRGEANVHATGATIVDRVTSTALNLMTQGILKEHEQDGSHKDIIRAPRRTQIASDTSITPNSETTDIYSVTALAANLTINAPSGSASDGQSLVLRIKDNGTARTLTWDSAYVEMGVTLPTTTEAGKKLYVGTSYDSNTGTWDIVGIGRE